MGSGGPSVNRPSWRPGAQSLSFLPEHWSPSQVHPPGPLAPSRHHPSGRAGAQASTAHICGSGRALVKQWPHAHLSSVLVHVEVLLTCVCVCSFTQANFLYSLQAKYLQNQVQGPSWSCPLPCTALPSRGGVPGVPVLTSTRVCGELHAPSLCPPGVPPLGEASFPLFQGIVWPQVFSGIVGNCVNGLANYILVSVLGQGVR